eukprot:TRINITY_DN3676_c0_g1_i1.p1 TRINITY_DN3676_c0_g1~~TRINITY_DN3676_c0_g1_i1.p1  ORF type:complete len:385 (+),score=27.58 TRINITY_DN3676_c0_g1_i1:450-1604(+)
MSYGRFHSFTHLPSYCFAPTYICFETATGLAAAVGIQVGELVMLQLVYEAAACCTSIIVEDESGIPLHIRTMDWEMPYLKGLTVDLDFMRGGERVFSASSWAGYVGILTGVRPQCFSASVNFRITGEGYWQNVKKAISYNWPIGFLLREVLETAESFDRAVSYLANSALIAPVYFTVAGTQKGQGCIITRNRTEEEQRLDFSVYGYLVQANIEHWNNNEDDDILYSLERRALAHSLIQSLRSPTEGALWDLISNPPIFNPLTVSGTFMCSAAGRLYSRIPQIHSWDRLTTGFRPTDTPIPFGGVARKTCKACGFSYADDFNIGAQCSHVGAWHAQFGDCNYLKCGLGLKSDVGQQHWGCCFSTARNSVCPKSGPHKPHANYELK